MSSINSARSVVPTPRAPLSPEQVEVVSALAIWQGKSHGDMTPAVKAAAFVIALAARRNQSSVIVDSEVLSTRGFDAVRRALAEARINLGERLTKRVAAENIDGVDDAPAKNADAVNQVSTWKLEAEGTDLEPLVNVACKQILSGIARGAAEFEVHCDVRVFEMMPPLDLAGIKLNWKFVGEVRAQDAGNYGGPGSILLGDGGERPSWLHSAKEADLAGFGSANSISGGGPDELDSKHVREPEPVSPVAVSPGLTAHLANVEKFKAVSTELLGMGLNAGTKFEDFRAATLAVHGSITAGLPPGAHTGARKNFNAEIEKIAAKFGDLKNWAMQAKITGLVSTYSNLQG
jgi:hypothetical protein